MPKAAPARPPSRARRPSAPGDSRTKLIIAIRAACRRKGMEDDDRRAVQQQLIGKGSMSDMTPAELGRVLDHLNKDWSQPVGGARAHIGKIRALWWSLYWIGAIERPDDEALTAFVKRQTGIEHIRFLDHMKAPSVIEALKSWLEREGVRWWSPDDIAVHEQIAARNGAPGTIIAAPQGDRHAVLIAIGEKLEVARVQRGTWFYAWVESWLGAGRTPWAMTATELDAAIRYFGKKLRRAIEAEG